MTDFRALCAELTDFLAELPFGTCEELVVRARAALAEPAPPAAGEPSAKDLLPAEPPDIPTTMAMQYRSAWREGVEDGWNEARAFLASRAADLLAQRPEPVPVPKGPTRDDLWELWLRLNNELPDRPAAVAEFWEHAQIDARARAAELLERQAAPVAVSDRLPGPEDCDAEGRCWWCDPIQWRWDFLVADNRKPSDYTHWLPAHALPLPQLPQQETTNG